ncbi:MAG: GxxExxY protein [Fimbriimonadaceae bacterium]
MPVTLDFKPRKLSQDEFGEIAYQVLGHAFKIHRDFGRFFDEEIYQIELARRCGDARIEVPITVKFEGFEKTYFVDLLVTGGAVFEIKTVGALSDRHRGQLVNYLLLTEFSHGQLINLRPESVDHEFVNATMTLRDRTAFDLADGGWDSSGAGSLDLNRYIVALLRDLGTGLDLALYEEAAIHFLGGEKAVVQEVVALVGGEPIGNQKVLCAAPRVALQFTTLKREDQPVFEDHLRRFLRHMALDAIQWVNVTREVVSFRTLRTEATKKD